MTPEKKQIQKRRRKRIAALQKSKVLKVALLPLAVVKTAGRLLLWLWRAA